MFTRLPVLSRHRERYKHRVASALHDAAVASSVHLHAIFCVKTSASDPLQYGTFWSWIDLLCSVTQQKQAPLLLPASIRIAFKMCSGLNDWGLYIWALGHLPQF